MFPNGKQLLSKCYHRQQRRSARAPLRTDARHALKKLGGTGDDQKRRSGDKARSTWTRLAFTGTTTARYAHTTVLPYYRCRLCTGAHMHSQTVRGTKLLFFTRGLRDGAPNAGANATSAPRMSDVWRSCPCRRTRATRRERIQTCIACTKNDRVA